MIFFSYFVSGNLHRKKDEIHLKNKILFQKSFELEEAETTILQMTKIKGL